MKQGTNAGLSLLIVLYFNHRGTENTENTDSGVLLSWKEATEAAFGRDVYSIYSRRTWGTSVFSVPLWRWIKRRWPWARTPVLRTAAIPTAAEWNTGPRWIPTKKKAKRPTAAPLLLSR